MSQISLLFIAVMDRHSAEWERVEKSSYPMFHGSTRGSKKFLEDMYVGGSVDLNGYTFHILDAQDDTFNYMEKHHDEVNKIQYKILVPYYRNMS